MGYNIVEVIPLERITSARKKAGLTQEQLASAIGVKRAVVSKYETGTIEPSISQLQKIAKALNVSLSYLLGISGAPEFDTEALDLALLEYTSSRPELADINFEEMAAKADQHQRAKAFLAYREKLSEELLTDWEKNRETYLSNIQAAKDNLLHVAEEICIDVQDDDDEAQRISDTMWLPARLNMLSDFISANREILRRSFPGWRESSLSQASGNSEDK